MTSTYVYRRLAKKVISQKCTSTRSRSWPVILDRVQRTGYNRLFSGFWQAYQRGSKYWKSVSPGGIFLAGCRINQGSCSNKRRWCLGRRHSPGAVCSTPASESSSPPLGSFNVHANPKMSRRSIDYGNTKVMVYFIMPWLAVLPVQDHAQANEPSWTYHTKL